MTMDTEEAQEMMRRIYLQRDEARGIERTILRTFQELGELSDAILSEQDAEESLARWQMCLLGSVHWQICLTLISRWHCTKNTLEFVQNAVKLLVSVKTLHELVSSYV